MYQDRFEPTITASERPQTQALDCAANGVRKCEIYYAILSTFLSLASIFPNLFSLATCDQVGYLQPAFYFKEINVVSFWKP
jgi:hypothetical protein